MNDLIVSIWTSVEKLLLIRHDSSMSHFHHFFCSRKPSPVFFISNCVKSLDCFIKCVANTVSYQLANWFKWSTHRRFVRSIRGHSSLLFKVVPIDPVRPLWQTAWIEMDAPPPPPAPVRSGCRSQQTPQPSLPSPGAFFSLVVVVSMAGVNDSAYDCYNEDWRLLTTETYFCNFDWFLDALSGLCSSLAPVWTDGWTAGLTAIRI